MCKGQGGYVPCALPMCIYNMLYTAWTKQKEFQKFLETIDNIDKSLVFEFLLFLLLKTFIYGLYSKYKS